MASAALPAHFEYVREIRRETYRDRNDVPCQIIVSHQQQLMKPGSPYKLAAIEVNQLAMQRHTIGVARIGYW